MVIGITGLPGAGKGTAAAYLVEKYGGVSKQFSGPLRDIVKRLHQSVTREHLQELAKALRGIFGNNVLAETLLGDLKADTTPLVVMEGFRYHDEYKILRQHPDFQFVAIEASFETRLGRIQQRTENVGDGQITAESFAKQHEHETEKAIPELIALADHHIDNSGNVTQLYAQLDALMTKLGHAPKS
ncbi:MAG: AAA family ATPase [Patescibacteria group bacterium]|jgi:dephospho-CoA kinase